MARTKPLTESESCVNAFKQCCRSSGAEGRWFESSTVHLYQIKAWIGMFTHE